MKVSKQFSSVALGLFLLSISQAILADKSIKLATTTSTENSGLLAVLHPIFEKKHGIRVDVLAMGTGKALRTGGNGDVDVVFVHAPAAELQYVAEGHFTDRAAVMHNDFVIVGPKADPAKLGELKTIDEALTRIVETQSTFVSRGDDSGTHKKEKGLWQSIGLTPNKNWSAWYAEAGQGMGAVLRIANDKQAYALTDRGTQIAFADKLSLVVLFEGDEGLFNPYHVMAVNPEKHADVKYDSAQKYIAFVTSKEGQAVISAYRKGGQQLFYPDVK
ncbi:MAG: tungsten ABC transporter substrate-binding protein [Cycloclasticus sp. symbiont of Poecilosclerida sp. M]|nr:MAG: tungsten ABC transporter substrate-binding protein [Cycloclasticus sp. symbiont of Poecilosclerida sp. M]